MVRTVMHACTVSAHACVNHRVFAHACLLAEGGVGSGRHWLEGTAELQTPLVSVLSGCLFADWGSDLNSGPSVLGNPGGEP